MNADIQAVIHQAELMVRAQQLALEIQDQVIELRRILREIEAERGNGRIGQLPAALAYLRPALKL